MSLSKCMSYTQAFYVAIAVVVAGMSLLSHWIGLGISASMVYQVVHDSAVTTWELLQPNFAINEQKYRVRIFSTDPLVIIIDGFVSSDEITHILRMSEDNYETSRVYSGYKESRYDPDKRVSESAKLDRKDVVVHRIEQRALEFQGWRGSNTTMQIPTVQRYQIDGFFDYHYDWDPALIKGNRVTTFMVYLVANCTGGGTNFPYLKRPNDTKWCDIIECTEEGIDGYQGVTFKPRVGSALFWENFHPNGSGHKAVYHAGLPVKSGLKVGLNMWSWDRSWRHPETLA